MGNHKLHNQTELTTITTKMVVTLAHGPEAGDSSVNSSMPFRDRDVSQSTSAAFSTASGTEHDHSSSAAFSSSSAHSATKGRENKRRPTFKALVRATTLSRMMTKLSSHQIKRRDSTGAFSSRGQTNTKTDQRRRTALSSRRTRAFFNDPNAYLNSVLTAEAAPFLHARISQMIPAQVYTLNDFDVTNKILEDGDFFETHRATFARHRSSPQTRQQPYRIKVLHHSIISQSDEVSLERAATKMMMEGLYLAHLSHPGIVKLRGHNKEGLDTVKHEQPEHFFFVTDHLGETLPQRLDSWKRWALARAKEERRRRHRAKYPAPLVPNTRDNPDTAILKDKLIKTYPEDLIVLKVNYALQILNALQFIHERGIVVRELRPDAIAFCDYPHHHTIQLCDLSSCREIPRGNNYIPPEGDWKTILMMSSPSTFNLMADVSERTIQSSVEDADDHTSSQFLSPVMEDDDDDDGDNNEPPESEPSQHTEASVEVQRIHSLEDPEISFTSHDPEPSDMEQPQPEHHHEHHGHHEGVEAQPSSSGISLHHLASGVSYVTDEVTHYKLDEEDDGHETKIALKEEEASSQESKQHPQQKEPMPDISEISNESFVSSESQPSQENKQSTPDASVTPATLLQSLETVNEDEDEHSFFEGSERSSDEPAKGLKSTGDNHSEDKSTASTGSYSSNHTNNIDGIFEVRTTVAARRYMAPDLFTGIGGFAPHGYNTQADIYSWAMVFTELLTETRPYGSKQLRKDWSRIVVGALRPNIKKYHFPRAVKCVLEQAWQARPEKRGSAAQLSKSLERVLVMLEGQQKPWDANAGEVSESEKEQRRPSVLALLKKSSEKDEEIINQGPTLPERASKYKRWMSKQPQTWSNIWDPRSTRKTKAEEEELQAAVQGKKEDLFARRVKANAVQGI